MAAHHSGLTHRVRGQGILAEDDVSESVELTSGSTSDGAGYSPISATEVCSVVSAVITATVSTCQLAAPCRLVRRMLQTNQGVPGNGSTAVTLSSLTARHPIRPWAVSCECTPAST